MVWPRPGKCAWTIDDYKLLWDVSVRTDHKIWARRSDWVIIDKRDKSYEIVDVAIPEHARVSEKGI